VADVIKQKAINAQQALVKVLVLNRDPDKKIAAKIAKFLIQ
jgi:hypothetical protein